jgi:iron complex transport system substrate-binding protein
VKALTALDIPVLVQPAAADLDDSYEQITQLGIATGHEAEAQELVESMRSEIDDIVSSLPEFADEPTYFHELDDGFFTVTSDTFIGQVYSLLGLRNIADKAPNAESGYPQLSVEYIVDADPDLIFLADTKCCDQSAQTVSERAGWQHISAVENDAIVELDDDVASRWGPRVVDFLRTVASEVAELEEAS